MLSSVKSRLGSFTRSSASTSCCPLSRSLTNQARDATSISWRMMIDGDWRTVDTDWWKAWKSSVGMLGWKWWTQFCWWFPVLFLRNVFGASAWRPHTCSRSLGPSLKPSIAILLLAMGRFLNMNKQPYISIQYKSTSWINMDFADGIHFSAIVAAGNVTSHYHELSAERLVSNEPEDFQQEFLVGFRVRCWWVIA